MYLVLRAVRIVNADGGRDSSGVAESGIGGGEGVDAGTLGAVGVVKAVGGRDSGGELELGRSHSSQGRKEKLKQEKQ